MNAVPLTIGFFSPKNIIPSPPLLSPISHFTLVSPPNPSKYLKGLAFHLPFTQPISQKNILESSLCPFLRSPRFFLKKNRSVGPVPSLLVKKFGVLEALFRRGLGWIMRVLEIKIKNFFFLFCPLSISNIDPFPPQPAPITMFATARWIPVPPPPQKTPANYRGMIQDPSPPLRPLPDQRDGGGEAQDIDPVISIEICNTL